MKFGLCVIANMKGKIFPPAKKEKKTMCEQTYPDCPEKISDCDNHCRVVAEPIQNDTNSDAEDMANIGASRELLACGVYR